MNAPRMMIPILAVPLVGIAAWMSYAYFVPSVSPMLQACVLALRDRLAAPSTFSLISQDEQRRLLPVLEYVEVMRSLGRVNSDGSLPQDMMADMALIEAGDARAPKIFTLTMVYDAQNRMGVPLRKESVCVTDREVRDPPVEWRLVLLDGQTYAQWVVSRPQ